MLPAIITPLAPVIPTQEGSHLRTITLYDHSLSFPLFALMQKVEQKNQGQHKSLRVSVRPAHSNTPII
jgi:hypothetical protein